MDRSDLLIPIALLGVLVAVLAMGTSESSLSMTMIDEVEGLPVGRVPVQGTEIGTGDLREEFEAQNGLPAEAITRSRSRAMILVQGQVWRAGIPVPEYELLFQTQAAGLDGEEVAWDRSDEHGRFQVRLPAGSYAVLAEESGPWLANLLVPDHQAELPFDIHLPDGVIRGRVLAEDGETPLPGATIRAVAASMPAGDPTVVGLMSRDGETRSGRDGSFELKNLRPGPHLLLANRGGLSSRVTLVSVETGANSSIELRLTGGQTLGGRIVGPGGEPVAADIYLSPGSQLQSLNPFYLHRGSSGRSDGAFRIEGLQPGSYRLFAFGETAEQSVAVQTRVLVRP
ncbi:MAG: carboxypeptidase regulatory-like domain-containing protein, partial [Planctomycetota bacterium]